MIDVECSHCGLPVPRGLEDLEAEHQFCCSGCRTAFEVIRGSGLDRYYRIRERVEAPQQPARTTGRSFESFDDPSFVELYGTNRPDGLAAVDLYLEGVHCAACVWLVERTPAAIAGVASCRLDIGRSLATVTWDPRTVQLSRIAGFLDSIGYPPHPYGAVHARDMERREDRALLIRIAVAGAAAGNIMLLAFALYGGFFYGIDHEYHRLFRWTSMALSLPAVLWCAAVFHRGAWGSLRTRRLHMDVPISIGILAGFTWGCHNTLVGRGEIYFDSVSLLIVLLLAGRYLQRRQQRSAARATELLFSLAPRTARRVDEREVREVPIDALASGDLVELRAGDTVPADGVVECGSSSLDLSLLTGESRPVEVGQGDPVNTGTINLSGVLRVRIQTTGENTRVGRLLRLVEESSRRRVPVVQLADRISAWFVAAVLGLAGATLLLWLRLEPERAVDHSIALLIVSCPCALGLATPLAVAAAIGRAARSRILIKGGDTIEVLARTGRMFVDKTGTLTEGIMSVVRWYGDTAVRAAVAAVESHSSHPVARALAAEYSKSHEPVVTEVRQHPGLGVVGRWGDRAIAIGSPSFLAEIVGVELSEHWRSAVEGVVNDSLTPVVVALDGTPVAVAGLGDPIRPDTPATVHRLRQLGWQVEVLSGDHPGIVQSLLPAIGLDRGQGGVSPERKARAVTEAAALGPVVMVGDGVNDAAALAAAHVGVGVHGGAEAALAAADVYLGEPGVAPIIRLLEGSRRTFAVIRRNLVFSLAYNALAVTLAMAGLMDPLVAAVLMPLSSITVVVSSYRATTFPPS